MDNKLEAIKLRKQGKSYNEISGRLSVPKSTLSYWFKNKKWSKKIKERLRKQALLAHKGRLIKMNKAHKEKWERWRQSFRDQAAQEFSNLKKKPLFLAGLMLYWGEGDKNMANGQVRLSNVDPKMIKVFVLFLEKTCLIPPEKVKGSLLLYPDLDDKDCREFWSKVSGISESQFSKTQFIKGRHPTKRLPRGVCNITVCSRGLKEKIFVWMKQYQKELI